MRRHVEVQVEGESIGSLPTPFIVGRDPECDVILPDSSVSRRHLRVTAAPNGLFVEDMGSSNGTWLDGKRMSRNVVPTGHPFIVGRVSVALRYVDGDSSTPYRAPQGVGGSSKHETQAVDIPMNFFDPAEEKPSMRLFDCPSCQRRLRCQSHTRRVKCRNCNAIIRFVGDTAELERAGDQPVEPSRRSRSSSSGLSSPSEMGNQWIEDARHGQNDRSAPRQMPVDQPLPPSWWESVWQSPMGRASAFLLGLSVILMFVGAVMGLNQNQLGYAFLGLGSLGAVAGAAGLSLSGRDTSGSTATSPSIAERLQNLAQLRDQQLISEAEYQARKAEILRDV